MHRFPCYLQLTLGGAQPTAVKATAAMHMAVTRTAATRMATTRMAVTATAVTMTAITLLAGLVRRRSLCCILYSIPASCRASAHTH